MVVKAYTLYLKSKIFYNIWYVYYINTQTFFKFNNVSEFVYRTAVLLGQMLDDKFYIFFLTTLFLTTLDYSLSITCCTWSISAADQL